MRKRRARHRSDKRAEGGGESDRRREHEKARGTGRSCGGGNRFRFLSFLRELVFVGAELWRHDHRQIYFRQFGAGAFGLLALAGTVVWPLSHALTSGLLVDQSLTRFG